MTIKVNTVEPRLAPLGQEKVNRPADDPAGPATLADISATSRPNEGSEARSVELTLASRQLADWVRAESSMAGVDEAKVARLRVEIEHGTYRLDSTRIAEGLLTSEREILQRMDRG